MPIRRPRVSTWTLAPISLTPTMCQAMLDAAAALGAKVQGISPRELWDAAMAVRPMEPREHRLYVHVRDTLNGYHARPEPGPAAAEAGLKGAKASSSAGALQAVQALLRKSSIGLDVDAALIVPAPRLPGVEEGEGGTCFEVKVDDASAAVPAHHEEDNDRPSGW